MRNLVLRRASQLKAQRRYYASHRAYYRSKRQAQRRDKKLADAAHDAVYLALRSGRLQKSPCQICWDPKSEAHHEDYSKPLEVIWLCRSDHQRIHWRGPGPTGGPLRAVAGLISRRGHLSGIADTSLGEPAVGRPGISRQRNRAGLSPAGARR